MKLKINKRVATVAAVNLASLIGFAAFMLSGSAKSQNLQYNYAAQRWRSSQSDMDYSQISVFFSDNSGFSSESLGSARAGLENALLGVSVSAEEGQKLVPCAYSASAGQATVEGTLVGKSEAEITAVGGDFFLFRNFTLLDGAFISDNDIMQDGAVIDRDLAWTLYGSYDIAGMNLTINGTQFYIAGVIDTLATEEEIKCAGELPRAYISYKGASELSIVDENVFMYGDVDGENTDMPSENFSRINCYEVIVPNPVENFAYNAVKDNMLGWECSVVCNTGRFDAFKRLKALKKIPLRMIDDNGIYYPYWENASRVTECKLSFIYLGAAICLVIPLITLLMAAMCGIKLLKKLKRGGIRFAKEIPDKIKRKLKGKTQNEKENL